MNGEIYEAKSTNDKMADIKRPRYVVSFPPFPSYDGRDAHENGAIIEHVEFSGMEIPLKRVESNGHDAIVTCDTRVSFRPYFSKITVPKQWVRSYQPFHANVRVPNSIDRIPLRYPVGTSDTKEVLGKRGRAVVRQLYKDGTCEFVFEDDPSNKYLGYAEWTEPAYGDPPKMDSMRDRVAKAMTSWFVMTMVTTATAISFMQAHATPSQIGVVAFCFSIVNAFTTVLLMR